MNNSVWVKTSLLILSDVCRKLMSLPPTARYSCLAIDFDVVHYFTTLHPLMYGKHQYNKSQLNTTKVRDVLLCLPLSNDILSKVTRLINTHSSDLVVHFHAAHCEINLQIIVQNFKKPLYFGEIIQFS